MIKKFLRRDSARYSKLGKLRKKKLKWNKPKGRDNKMREKRKGYPKVVSIGHKKSLKGKEKMILVNNISELERLGKEKAVVIGKIGKRKKIEMVKKAKEMKIEIKNLNIEKFLKKLNKTEGVRK
ncbi:MAG TPA: eL32 family ribosomal protein [Candidatus Nanoarchaeia archaeon]|nr:hypothetical protein [uncultured archaeon]HLA23155.1 eL32 family ribosomal protein [Candidatus Nanoarchaeia archaeon]